MKNEITVRRAEPSDAVRIAELLCAIARLHGELVPHIFKSEGGAKHDAESVKEMIADPNNIILSATDSCGTIVGYAIATLKTAPKSAIMRERRIFYVDDLCVDENCRRGGVGRLLMDACVAHARALECDALELNVWQANASALAFYEAYGMKTQRRQMEMML